MPSHTPKLTTVTDIPDRAMVIFAHPDDAEFLCSGTVARFTRHGYRVQYVLATSGDKGSNDPDATPEQLIATREAEQHAAADVLGIEEVTFLRHMDGELEVSVGEETRKLKAGESLRYHADRHHRIVNTGEVPAHATMVLVEGRPQAEQRR